MHQNRNSSKGRLLVVDDDECLLRIMEITLSAYGEVINARDLLEAKSALAPPARFDLILTDFNLPDGDGLDLAREVERLHPGTPLILMTAQIQKQARFKELCKMPEVTILEKPFLPGKLREKITAALARARP